MSYVSYEYFKSLYGEEIPAETFNRIAWDADREMDKATMGIDNVRKLQVAFPTDEYDAEAVKRCICKVIYTINHIENVKKQMVLAMGYDQTEAGMRGKVVSSVSAGSESVTYSNGITAQNSISLAASDEKERSRMLRNIIQDALAGIRDANGVNLLYAGRYVPR